MSDVTRIFVPLERHRKPRLARVHRLRRLRPANCQRPAPLVGRVRLAALARAVEAWSTITVGQADGYARLAIAQGLLCLARLAKVWDTPEGQALAVSALTMDATRVEYAKRRRQPVREPAHVYDFAAEKARRAGGAS